MFEDTFKLHISQAFTTYKSQFGLSPDDEMVKVEEQYLNEDTADQFDFGTVVSRFHQFHKGLRVEQKSLTVSSKCSVVVAISGSIVPNLSVDTSGHLSDAEALTYALSHVNKPGSYTWLNGKYEQFLKLSTIDDSSGIYDSTITTYPKGELIIAKEYGSSFADTTPNFHLCWKYNIGYFDTVRRDTMVVDSNTFVYDVIDTVVKSIMVYVNADDGSILGAFDPSMGAFYKDAKVWTYYYSDKFDLECETCTFGCPHKLKDHRKIQGYWDGYTNGNESKSSDDQWVCCVKEREPASGMWAVERSYDYFASQQGVSKGNVLKVIGDAKAGVGAEYERQPNSDEVDMIKLGDASPYGQTSGTAIDLMAHEFTHREISRSSTLGFGTYQYNEPYVLNEGFADIFGLLAESWVKGSCDWTIGEDWLGGIYKRRFVDPENDHFINSTVVGSCMDYSTMNNYYNEYPYSGGGILRKWFNHTSQGASNWTNPGAGLGLTKAGRLAFITMYWNCWGGSDFYDTRRASLLTADIHFGGRCGAAWNAVEKSWSDVGVGTTSPCNTLRIRSPRVVNPEWLNTDDIKIGVFTTDCNGDPINVTSYTWLLPSGYVGTYSGGGSVFTLTGVPNYTSREIAVKVNYLNCDNDPVVDTLRTVLHFSNECSMFYNRTSVSTGIESLAESNSKSAFKVYPNPAFRELNITATDINDPIVATFQDLVGRIVKTIEINLGNNFVSISNLSKGLYVLTIYDPRGTFYEKVTIQ